MRASRSPRGFTLIEILVVLVIITIVVGFAMLKLGTAGKDTQVDEECRRIAGLLTLLQERAALEGRDFGVLVSPDRYQFVTFEKRRQRWEKFDQDREFRRRDLPKGLAFQLELESRAVVLDANPSVPAPGPLADDADASSQDSAAKPQIIIAASGENTPFRLTLVRDGSSSQGRVAADSFGKIVIENSGQNSKRT